MSFLAWSFLAQLTENISANTKCHWDIIVLLFSSGFLRQIRAEILFESVKSVGFYALT